MKARLITSQTQKQVLTPSMQQSIEVLLLPLTDLSMAIEQELQDNPLLETLDDDTTPTTDDEIRDKIDQVLKAPDERIDHSYDEDEEADDHPIGRDETLEEKLLKQLGVEFTDPLKYKIGEMIIGNLDEDGYLKISIAEIAQAVDIQNHDLIESVLKTIQTFDPVGIASRDLQECLLVQAQEKLLPEEPIAYKVLEQCFPELGQKKHQEIAKKMRLPLDEIKRAARLIVALLDPKPARNFRPIRGNIYIKPDILITTNEETGFQVHLNNEGIPRLRVNQLYKNLLKQTNVNSEEKEFIRERLKNALLFIRSIAQRGQTVRAIAEFILEKQKNFFNDEINTLTPMNLKDVAVALDRNESTISRAIQNKYMETPQGLFPMKFFFSQSLGENAGQAVSNRTVKNEIKEMIDAEDKAKPISDQEIQTYFEAKGIKVARRTVAKYRQMSNILPSHLRKQ